MTIYKALFANICILLTLAYLANLLSKYFLNWLSKKTRLALLVLAFIAVGSISMQFGLTLSDGVLFDLRYIPLIIAPSFIQKPSLLFLIGIGIGLTRLPMAMDNGQISPAAWAGFANMAILGLVCAGLNRWTSHKHWGFLRKITVFILVLNTVNMLDIALFGVLPSGEYLRTIATKTYPAGILLSLFFSLIVRDFQLEYQRQENLRVINRKLAVQNHISQEKTAQLEQAHLTLEEKNRQLLLHSKSKTEFLANMSHELRTPLNSLLILSEILAENPNKTLNEEEASYAQMIHTSGEELLSLINDILDLAKVEAGRINIARDAFNLTELPQLIERNFEPLAQSKKLHFMTEMAPDVPKIIYTDGQRLQQILKNLLANAFKFTDTGRITMSLYSPDLVELKTAMMHQKKAPPILSDGLENGMETEGQKGDRKISGSKSRNGSIERGDDKLYPGDDWIAFAITDTGIGIPEEKKRIIFEAFEQGDGTTSRKYGGTGLGLSISREFARLLGGFITLESTVGSGSTFTLYLPCPEEE